MSDIMTNCVPYIPLRGQVFFPDTVVGFDIGRDKSIAAVDLAMNGDKYFVVSAQKDTNVADPAQSDCYMTGVLLRIQSVVKKNEEFERVLVTVGQRVRISDIYEEGGCLRCDFTFADDTDNDRDDVVMIANVRVMFQQFYKYLEMNGINDAAIRSLTDGIEDSAIIANIVANELDVDYSVKQTLLEIDSVKARIEHLIDIIGKEVQILAIAKRINNRVVKNMNRGQREYYLREQLQVIKDELGEEEDLDDEAKTWKDRLDELKLPEKVDTKVRKEIEKFTKMNAMSPDANVSRTYIETILELPWHSASKTNLNIKKAEKVLNEDHYGLEKVKERILENLAVMHLTKDNKAPILCLVGPPGVGKTSIARSVARATGREFVRMSLGGVRDEAEIRGHRRTYIGAIPGRVINSLIECGTNNPLFLFDEVDKIGSDFRGDPASALLEVLDPEQNSTFTDHYLEIPFDLSNVMFITTANTTETIPTPLLDRMEIIELSSYTEEEKVQIAMQYLIPKKLKENGIKKSQLSIAESAVRDIIEYYTREAGVRNLEREIGNACRKVAKNIVSGKGKKNAITAKTLEKFIGKRKYIEDIDSKEPAVGTATGLAWTAVGGVTLTVETCVMPGKGNLILTGSLGDVMKESAQIAIGYIRSKSVEYGIKDDYFKDYDIQIHFPDGATPKDGPSAGITMTSALYSLLTGKPLDRTYAMTGEITLRGNVTRIGGLKEKSLAAYRQGIKKVLIPKENVPDLEDIPASVRKKMEFIPVEHFEDVIPLLFK